MSALSEQLLRDAAGRLHHIGMRYVGAIAEVARGRTFGFLPAGDPGVHECRDLIDLMLLTRAEINGLSKLLVDAKVITPSQLEHEFTEQYNWFAEVKAKQFGVEVFDGGLRFTKESK